MIYAATCSKRFPTLCHLTRSGVVAIFFQQETVLSLTLPHSGNYHVFYRLPVTTSAVTKSNTIFCLLGGSNICAQKLLGGFILFQKKYPNPRTGQVIAKIAE
jgi:hypothetical protein